MNKSKVIDLLLLKNRPTYSQIAKIAKCDYRYVGRLADMLGLTSKRPIMDFRGLLRGDK